MEHGQLVQFDRLGADIVTGYITIIHEDKYLFLSTETLNRRSEFLYPHEMNEKITDLGVNILNIPLEQIIENYVEETDAKYVDYIGYRCGRILRHKDNGKLYSLIAIYGDDFIVYRIDLETFRLSPLGNKDSSTDRQIATDYYMYDFTFADLGFDFIK